MALTKNKGTDNKVFKLLRLRSGEDSNYSIIENYTVERLKDGSSMVTVQLRCYTSEI